MCRVDDCDWCDDALTVALSGPPEEWARRLGLTLRTLEVRLADHGHPSLSNRVKATRMAVCAARRRAARPKQVIESDPPGRGSWWKPQRRERIAS